MLISVGGILLTQFVYSVARGIDVNIERGVNIETGVNKRIETYL